MDAQDQPNRETCEMGGSLFVTDEIDCDVEQEGDRLRSCTDNFITNEPTREGNQDTEATISSTDDNSSLAGYDEVFHSRVEDSVEEDPRRRPGAHAIPGIFRSLSFASDEATIHDETDSIPEPVVLWVAQSAQLVDEAAEEQCRLELEHERQRNRELASRIRQIESSAVVAIPILEEATGMHIHSTST